MIDDFFAIGITPLPELKPGSPESRMPSLAAKSFHQAKAAYQAEGLRGSDAKDVYDQPKATVIGAEVDSRHEIAKQGLVTVAAPTQKRLSLAWICLESAALAYTSDALNASLVGSLVSALCFRRCAMCLLDGLFGLVPPAELDTEHPVLRPLHRRVAEELVLAGVFLPVLASNIQAPCPEHGVCK